MKFFKPKTLVPIDRKTYLDGTIKGSLVLLIFVTVILYLVYSHLKIEYMVCAALVYAVVTTFFVKSPSYNGRLKDLYPDHKPDLMVICIIHLIPLLYIPFIIFLCLKEKSEEAVPPKILYKNSYFSLVAIPLIAFGLMSSQMAYWLSGPSTYYIVDLSSDTANLLSLKGNMEKLNFQGSPVDYYMKDKMSETNSTELLLLTALALTRVFKESERGPASESSQKSVKKIKYSIMLLQEINKVIAIGEKKEFKFSDYSPLQWMSHVGLIEITLLSVVEMKLRQEFLVKSVATGNEILQILEVQFPKLPPETQSLYQADLMKVTKDLRGSKKFRSLASLN